MPTPSWNTSRGYLVVQKEIHNEHANDNSVDDGARAHGVVDVGAVDGIHVGASDERDVVVHDG